MFGDLPHTEIDEDTACAWLRGLEAGTHPWLRAKAHRFPALAPPEWRRLQAELPHGSARDLATVLVSTGLRFGEVTALQAPGMYRSAARTRAWWSSRRGRRTSGTASTSTRRRV
jgi:hypothetical protein